MSDTDENNLPQQPSFEQALQQLETIVQQLEDGDVGLEEALKRYEQGVSLLKQCYGLLERAERRIELLSALDEQGNPVAAPFDDEATLSLDEKAEKRSQRRSKPVSRGKSRRTTNAPDSVESENDEPGGLF